MEQEMFLKPSSIYYVGSKPFVNAWFQCLYSLNKDSLFYLMVWKFICCEERREESNNYYLLCLAVKICLPYIKLWMRMFSYSPDQVWWADGRRHHGYLYFRPIFLWAKTPMFLSPAGPDEGVWGLKNRNLIRVSLVSATICKGDLVKRNKRIISLSWRVLARSLLKL